MGDGRRRVDGRDRGLQSRLRRAGGIAVAFAAVGALAAGCGGGAASPRGSAKPSETTLLIEFSACLRAHGLPDFPDPQSEAAGGGFGSSSLNPYLNPSARGTLALNDYTPQFQAAEKHCSSIARASLFIMTPAQIQALSQQTLKRELAQVACLRKHGFPDAESSAAPASTPARRSSRPRRKPARCPACDDRGRNIMSGQDNERFRDVISQDAGRGRRAVTRDSHAAPAAAPGSGPMMAPLRPLRERDQAPGAAAKARQAARPALKKGDGRR